MIYIDMQLPESCADCRFVEFDDRANVWCHALQEEYTKYGMVRFRSHLLDAGFDRRSEMNERRSEVCPLKGADDE